MLLKYSPYEKRNKLNGKPQRSAATIKANGKGSGHRKGAKGVASKRIKLASRREETTQIPSIEDNSNDSGLGFDHHLDFSGPKTTKTSFIEQEYCWAGDDAKRQRLDIKLESDNANDDYTFPQTRIHNGGVPVCEKAGKAVLSVGKGIKRSAQAGQNVGTSRDGKVQLVILSQPEMQHRARYQTEGSRGAVKDRSGNGFPIVKLNGYNKPVTLEVYIGTDQGRVAPHMFYQACRVSGKNSTPCLEKKVEGTVVIEIELDPGKDMIATCDCVGILKERNVDVEHRFPDESSGRNKKKSTRCRMVFRTVITRPDGTPETLQVTSQPIICTQPPGVPEISKKSLSSCPVTGGVELFILGKNFLKDTRVVLSEGEPNSDSYWEAVVHPDKEFLQQSHLVCVVPPYKSDGVKDPTPVRLQIVSSGRSSEPHTFLYTPQGTHPMQAFAQDSSNSVALAIAKAGSTSAFSPPTAYPSQSHLVGVPLIQLGTSHVQMPTASTFISDERTDCKEEEEVSSTVLMPPPPPVCPPRSPSSETPVLIPGGIELKREVESPPEVPPVISPDLSISQSPSMATLRQFVSSSSLPALSVETYLSKIEEKGKEPHLPAEPMCSIAAQTVLNSSFESTGIIPPADMVQLCQTGHGFPATVPIEILAPPTPDFPPVTPVFTPASHFPPTVFASLESPVAASLPPTLPPVVLPGTPLVAEPAPTAPNATLPQVQTPVSASPATQPPPTKKVEDGLPLVHELAQMCENDLLSYINPSCFDQV